MVDQSFFARMLGVFYLAFSLAMIIGPEAVVEGYRGLKKNRPHSFLAGFFTIFIGAIIVAGHNVWALSLAVITSIAGWMALIKGVLLVAMPENLLALSGQCCEDPCRVRIMGIVGAAFGGLILYSSF